MIALALADTTLGVSVSVLSEFPNRPTLSKNWTQLRAFVYNALNRTLPSDSGVPRNGWLGLLGRRGAFPGPSGES